jgi:hypothetical protein
MWARVGRTVRPLKKVVLNLYEKKTSEVNERIIQQKMGEMKKKNQKTKRIKGKIMYLSEMTM